MASSEHITVEEAIAGLRSDIASLEICEGLVTIFIDGDWPKRMLTVIASCEQLATAVARINQMAQIPAAEYVPALVDIMKECEGVLAMLKEPVKLVALP